MKNRVLLALARWLDADVKTVASENEPEKENRIDWVRCIPFLIMHLGCLGVLWVGISWIAALVSAFLYFSRMFFVTAFYHRYFSHRTYKTSRWAQFVFAALGASAVQRGALWWAAHHRIHHIHADTEQDPHSPGLKGFWWSHMGWITTEKNFCTNMKIVPDLAKYPELVFLNRFDVLIPLLLAGSLYAFGELLKNVSPSFGTSGAQMLIWGFFVSTVVLFHATCTINSLSHQIGKTRFATGDSSKNNFFLALLTLGEGWHNNHHHYQSSVRQGFYWWEIDITYYLLKSLNWLGLVRDLRPVPDFVFQELSSQKGVPGK